MNEQSLLAKLIETIDQHRAERRAAVQEPAPPGGPRWLRWQVVLNIGTLLMVVVLLLTIPSLAAPLIAPSATSTSTISYQGRLADDAGTPLTGMYNMEFRLYDVPTGGVPLWEEFWTGANSVAVSDGLFNVMLGSIDNTLASSIEGQDELHLGITVGSDSEMTPRVQLGSVPFAMNAGWVGDRGPGLVQTWAGPSTTIDATGPSATRHTFDTGIDVTVPASETRYYLVTYRGRLLYWGHQATPGQDSFHASWGVEIVDGGVVLARSTIVSMGAYRVVWNPTFPFDWSSHYSPSWVIELGEGTHSLDVAIRGYSDGTMETAEVVEPVLQVFPLP